MREKEVAGVARSIGGGRKRGKQKAEAHGWTDGRSEEEERERGRGVRWREKREGGTAWAKWEGGMRGCRVEDVKQGGRKEDIARRASRGVGGGR